MVIVLGLIAAVTSLLLAFVYVMTKDPIEKTQQKKLNDAISSVVPGLDRFETRQVKAISGDDSLTFYDAYKGNEKIGTAVKTYDNNGFGGRIEIIVGFDNDGKIINDVPLTQSETPGLGAKMDPAQSDFTFQFRQKDPAIFKLKVKKDKGDVDAITAATISSRAYCRAVDLAYKTYMAQKGVAQ